MAGRRPTPDAARRGRAGARRHGLRGGEVDIVAWRALAAGVVALALQVATNYANDYSDGVRGTDDPGQRVGPVRLVGWGIKPPGAVKRAALRRSAWLGRRARPWQPRWDGSSS